MLYQIQYLDLGTHAWQDYGDPASLEEWRPFSVLFACAVKTFLHTRIVRR